jgi:hypothetical protein
MLYIKVFVDDEIEPSLVETKQAVVKFLGSLYRRES